MKVYLDDDRETPEGWHRTYTVEETIELLKTGKVEELSLDNDLGWNRQEGYKVLDWLEEQVFNGNWFVVPKDIDCHSANASAVVRMWTVINRIEEKRICIN